MSLQPIQVIQAEEYSAPTMQLFNSVLQSAREASESVQRQNQFKVQALQQVNNQLQQRIGNIELQTIRNQGRQQLQSDRLEFEGDQREIDRGIQNTQWTKDYELRYKQVENQGVYQDGSLKNQEINAEASLRNAKANEERVEQGWLTIGQSGMSQTDKAVIDLNKVLAEKIEQGLANPSTYQVRMTQDGVPSIFQNGKPISTNDFLHATSKIKENKDFLSRKHSEVKSTARKATSRKTPLDISSLTADNIEARLLNYASIDGNVYIDPITYTDLLEKAQINPTLGLKLQELHANGRITFQREQDDNSSLVMAKDLALFKSLFNVSDPNVGYLGKKANSWWGDGNGVSIFEPDVSLEDVSKGLLTKLKELDYDGSQRKDIYEQVTSVSDYIINNYPEYSTKTRISEMTDIFEFDDKGQLKNINLTGNATNTKINTDPLNTGF